MPFAAGNGGGHRNIVSGCGGPVAQGRAECGAPRRAKHGPVGGLYRTLTRRDGCAIDFSQEASARVRVFLHSDGLE